MNTLTNVDTATLQQAIITGQVINSVSLEAVKSPLDIQLATRRSSELSFRPSRALLNISGGGFFAFIGIPRELLPEFIVPTDSFEFQLSIASPGYSSVVEVISVPAADAIINETTETFAGTDVPMYTTTNAPIASTTIVLSPIAVGIEGVVHDDNELNSPIAGANVQVIAPETRPPVVCNAQGRYRIENLPLSPSITLAINFDSTSLEVEHVIDYKKRLNARTIVLNG